MSNGSSYLVFNKAGGVPYRSDFKTSLACNGFSAIKYKMLQLIRGKCKLTKNTNLQELIDEDGYNLPMRWIKIKQTQPPEWTLYEGCEKQICIFGYNLAMLYIQQLRQQPPEWTLYKGCENQQLNNGYNLAMMWISFLKKEPPKVLYNYCESTKAQYNLLILWITILKYRPPYYLLLFGYKQPPMNDGNTMESLWIKYIKSPVPNMFKTK